jgi:hypothetical protein
MIVLESQAVYFWQLDQRYLLGYSISIALGDK